MRPSPLSLSLSLSLALAAGALGCDKKEPPSADHAPATVASAATQAPPPPSAGAKEYVLADTGKIGIDMPAPKEDIKGSADKVAGDLQIDPANLAATRGTVKVDLTTLKTATFENDADKNAKQTEHALNWLEVGNLVTPEEREKNRFIVYTIQGIEGLSATDLAKVAPTKEGGEDVRTVTATTKGEVFLHGHKAPRDAQVAVTFHGPAEKPTRVEVKTTKPFEIILADHEVKPRDNVGKIAQSAFNLIGTKVAEKASVSFELSAKPK